MIIFLFILGSIFGSFAHLLVNRSLEDESIVYPPSHCPNCKKNIAYRDLIPVISYIFLKGRCRYCKVKIPISYFLFEIGFGIFTILFLKENFTIDKLFIYISLVIGFSISLIDFKRLYIDMTYIYILLFLGLVYRFLYLSFDFEFLKICLIFSFLFFLVFFLSGKNIGDGDYFFYMVLFLYIKNNLILAFILISIWSAAIISIILAIKYRTLKIKIGFCPYIFIGYLLVIL